MSGRRRVTKPNPKLKYGYLQGIFLQLPLDIVRELITAWQRSMYRLLLSTPQILYNRRRYDPIGYDEEEYLVRHGVIARPPRGESWRGSF